MTATSTSAIRTVYKAPDDKEWELKQAAERALRDRQETVLHLHVNQSEFLHTRCEFYVLDWHDEPQYSGLHQIAVIHPPAVI